MFIPGNPNYSQSVTTVSNTYVRNYGTTITNNRVYNNGMPIFSNSTISQQYYDGFVPGSIDPMLMTGMPVPSPAPSKTETILGVLGTVAGLALSFFGKKSKAKEEDQGKEIQPNNNGTNNNSNVSDKKKTPAENSLKLKGQEAKINLDKLEGMIRTEANKSLFDQFDKDHDGVLNKEEASNMAATLKNAAGNSIISNREMNKSFGKNGDTFMALNALAKEQAAQET